MYKHKPISEPFYARTNMDRIYTFPIDLAVNRFPLSGQINPKS